MTTPQPLDPSLCERVRADLPGFDGHELSPRRAAELRSHLADCAECGELAASYRSMRRTLAELRDVPVTPPNALLDSLLDQVAHPGVADRAAVVGRGVVSGARPKVVAAGVGVGAIAAGGLGLLAWRAARARRVTA